MDDLEADSEQLLQTFQQLNVSSGSATETTCKQAATPTTTTTTTPKKKYVMLNDLVCSPLGGTASPAVAKLFQDESDEKSPEELEKRQHARMDAIPDKLLLRTGKVGHQC